MAIVLSTTEVSVGTSEQLDVVQRLPSVQCRSSIGMYQYLDGLDAPDVKYVRSCQDLQ